MAAALKLLRKKRGAGNNVITFVYQCVLSGNYTTSGAVGNVGTLGETLNFDAATNPGYVARGVRLPRGVAGKAPANVDFRVTRCPAGYDAQVEQNAVAPTPANMVLRIFTTAASELGTGAYPAGLTEATGLTIEVDIPAKYI